MTIRHWMPEGASLHAVRLNGVVAPCEQHEAEALAREKEVSRSRLYAIALEEYLRRHESRAMLRELNAVYQAEPEANERALAEGMARQQRRIVEGEW
mgnify:CR=1 FL=1